MQENSLCCPRCRAIWPSSPEALANLASCPSCGREFRINIYPAFNLPRAVGSTSEAVILEGEAACFYHPQKRAVIPCTRCGRFLCALCHLDFKDEHLCPSCLEVGRIKGGLNKFDTVRTRYDSAALYLA